MTAVTEFPHDRDKHAGDAPVTMLNPDFPFSYDEYLTHPAGLGSVPEEMYGTEVAVVGAGLSGLITAYELMKLGLKPVVHEADRIGGRLRTDSFSAAPDVVADLGGMRFPVAGNGPSVLGPVTSGFVAMNRAPPSMRRIARVIAVNEYVRVSPSTT